MAPSFDLEPRAADCTTRGATAGDPGPVTVRCAACNARTQCLPASGDRELLDQIDRRLVVTRRKVGTGHPVFRAGDRFRSLYAVRTGFVKTLAYTRDGRAQVTGFRMSGDLLGLDGISGGRHHVDAIALEDSQVCEIAYGALQALARELPAVQDRFHRLLSDEIVHDQDTMVQLGSTQAVQRLAGLLLELSDRLNERGYSPSVLVLRMARSEIASYLGVELETICRVFSRLQAAGLMRVTQREVRITDRDGLKRVRDGGA